jgi:hypothetical protein
MKTVTVDFRGRSVRHAKRKHLQWASGEAARAGRGIFLGRLAGTAVEGAAGVAMAAICLQRVLS